MYYATTYSAVRRHDAATPHTRVCKQRSLFYFFSLTPWVSIVSLVRQPLVPRKLPGAEQRVKGRCSVLESTHALLKKSKAPCPQSAPRKTKANIKNHTYDTAWWVSGWVGAWLIQPVHRTTMVGAVRTILAGVMIRVVVSGNTHVGPADDATVVVWGNMDLPTTAMQGCLWLCDSHSHEGCLDVTSLVLVSCCCPPGTF